MRTQDSNDFLISSENKKQSHHILNGNAGTHKGNGCVGCACIDADYVFEEAQDVWLLTQVWARIMRSESDSSLTVI